MIQYNTVTMNKALAKLGQASLMVMAGYEIGHSVGENEIQSVEKVETKVIHENDNEDFYYIIIILLIALIILAAVKMIVVMMKKDNRAEQIQLRQS